jgi:dTDP-glucose 4,6-dehydratase/UDP-glucose 4-epimerase
LGSHLKSFFQKENEVWGADVFTDYNEKNFFLLTTGSPDFQNIFRQHKFDVCINASGAASVPESIKNPGRDFELNVNNVFHLLDAIRLYAPTCKFINLSSAAVYGNPEQMPVREDSALNPVSPYGFHKWQAEQLCQEFYIGFEIPTCSIRIFSAYGPGLKKQIFWDLYLKSQQSSTIELFGNGTESRDFIFIEDISLAVDCLIKKGSFRGSVYNLAFGQGKSIRFVSESFLNALGWKGELVFNGVNRTGDPNYWEADISKIRQLGFVPTTTLDLGIKKYIEWLSQLV